MKVVPFDLESFDTPWVRERVAAELSAVGSKPERLQTHDFEGELTQHFVHGIDTQGMLWTTTDAFVDNPTPHVFTELKYHPSATLDGTIVHGGAITAIIDASAAGCGVIALGFPAVIATAEQTVHFRRAVLIGETSLLHCQLDLEATAPESRHHTVVVWSELYDEDGTTQAQSTSTITIPKRARAGVTPEP